MLAKIFFMVLAALLFNGCAPESKQALFAGDTTHEYDSTLVQFNKDLVALGYNPIDFSQTTIRKGELPNSDAYGMCYGQKKASGGPTNISVSINVSNSTMAIVLYHEIGHCFLGLEHSNGYSLMYARVATSQIAEDFHSSDSKRLELVKIMIQDSAQ